MTAVAVPGSAYVAPPAPAVGRSAAELLHEARSRERAACIPEAIRCYEGAISAAERSGEKPILAEALRRLAVVMHHRNESARARELCKRSYKVACDLKNDVLAAEALNTLGGLAVRMGDIEEARDNFRKALERGGHARELRARAERLEQDRGRRPRSRHHHHAIT